MDKIRQTEAGWRPISSVPKDGSEIILRAVSKESGEIEIKNAWFEDGTWKRICYSRNTYEYFPWYNITHWMPVPGISDK